VARAKRKASSRTKTTANVVYEAQLWQIADALRGVARELVETALEQAELRSQEWAAA
jgi:hypothetical protein